MPLILVVSILQFIGEWRFPQSEFTYTQLRVLSQIMKIQSKTSRVTRIFKPKIENL